MKKKGFTLIELLAVIVILAIIALIVTPVVSNIITSSRNSANARSVEGHIDNIEYGIMTKAFNEGKDIRYLDKTITTDGTINDRNTKFGFDFPNNDNIVCEKYAISNGLVIGATGCKESSWKLTYSYTSTGGAVSGDIEVPTTYASYAVGDAINFDVTNGTKCTEADVTTNYTDNAPIEGLSTGCLRFFAFLDDENSETVEMVLDHDIAINKTFPNAYNTIKDLTSEWNGVELPENYTQTAYNSSGNTMTIKRNWYTDGFKARLMTVNEVARIVGKSGFSSETATSDDWFYLDGYSIDGSTWQTKSASGKGNSSYWWLFDYVTGCQPYGCKHNSDNSSTSTWGIWLADSVSYVDGKVWLIGNGSKVEASSTGNGRSTRPVIKVKKEKLS